MVPRVPVRYLSAPAPAPSDKPKDPQDNGASRRYAYPSDGRELGTLPASQGGSLPALADIPAALARGAMWLVKGTGKATVWTLQWTAGALKTLVTDPARAAKNTRELWDVIKHEAHHYWVGSKLLVAEMKTSAVLVRRVGRGDMLTRRERQQLRRTMGDLLRMVPFAIIVIIPFAELSLPVLLKLFPNMLPSQFEKSETRQEAYRRSLNVRLEIHGVLQEILADRTLKRAAAAGNGEAGKDGAGAGLSMDELLDQLEAVRAGKNLPTDSIVKVAKVFQDELTIDNMPRGQLAALAKYMGLSPFTPDPLLRMQLRVRFRDLKRDDRDLYIEGIDSLTKEELKAACEARGMRAVGLPETEYRRQLNEWLRLSVKDGVPATLLVLSSAFQIANVPGAREQRPAQALQESISAIDDHVVAEAVLAQSAAQEDAPTPAPAPAPVAQTAEAAAQAAKARVEKTEQKTNLLTMKLESIEFQNALIKAEREAAESEAESERAAAQAEQAAQAAAAAATGQTAEVEKLRAAAASAAKHAAQSKAVAAQKHQIVVRMRAEDAARAAAHLGSSKAPAAAAAKQPSEAETKAQAKVEEAIAELAQEASMARETVVLQKLRAVRKKIEQTEAAAKARTAGAGAAAGESAGEKFIRNRLDRMLHDIEKDFEKVKANINVVALLRAADADRDGQVTQQELHQVLRHLVDTVGSEEAAAALIKRLDNNKDGSISVAELERFLDKYAEALAKAEVAMQSDEPEEAAAPAPAPAAAAAAAAAPASDSATGQSSHRNKQQ